MTQDAPDDRPLELPPVEEVERTLGLEEEDRRDLPGLYRLNAVDIPVARAAAFTLALVIVPLHNRAVLGAVDWTAFLGLAALVEGYCLASWWVLRRWFGRVTRVHLGTVFVSLDLLVMTLLVHATGGPASLYWPIYFVRVADQMWISQRRALLMGAASVALYAALVAVWGLQGAPVDWAGEGMKLVVLAALTVGLATAARQPWNVRQRTVAARDLILQLEELSRQLDRERVRAEQASRAKSEFLARMSHELRTPLNSVLGFTNVLLKKGDGTASERDADYLRRIRRNATHLLALIDDILDLARIEAGRMEIRPAPVDLTRLVRETVDQVEGRFLGTDVLLTVHVPGNLAPMRADEDRLRQVLVNLIGNALKFTERGSVSVEVTTRGDDRRPSAIRVRDTGCGIPAERLPHIFEAFEQGDRGPGRRHEGSGLGLAISRTLCRLMGFELTAESEVGRGSTFTVLVPPDATVDDGADAASDRRVG